MEFSSSFYGVIAFLLLFYCYFLWTVPKTNKHKSPPRAGGARPFIGHLHLMGGVSATDLPHFKLGALADKYGPIFSIRLGVRRAVVVSSSELSKQIFTTNDVAVSSRPRSRAAKHIGYDLAMFGLSPYGPYWREMRKLISVELLSIRRLELLSHVRVSELSQFISELYKLWEEKKDSSGKLLVDMKQWSGDLNLNVILRMVAGKRFQSGDDAEETQRYREVFREFFHLAGVLVPADAFPYLGWLDLGGYEKKMKENSKALDKIVGGWLAEHQEKEYSGKDKPQDFMDVMLSAVKGPNFPGKYDADIIIKSALENLIAGGTDTTSVMIIWALSLLLNHRHVLKRVQQELDDQIGRDRRVTEADIKNLPYLSAVVKETLRLYPAGPLAGIREFSEDTIVGNYHIPKDTWLIVNLWKLQRDPLVWPDNPTEFMPERFFKMDKKVDVKGQDFELIPFGAGRRICPGMNFGLQMIYLVLATFLQAFEVSTVADEAVDMTESAGLTNTKATPLDVLVAPRLSPGLY